MMAKGKRQDGRFVTLKSGRVIFVPKGKRSKWADVRDKVLASQKKGKGPRTIRRPDITTEVQLDKAIRVLSKDNPKKVVTAYARLGAIDLHVYDRQPTTDTADTIQTYQHYGGFFKNGKIVQPTETWRKRHRFVPVSR